MRIKIYKTVPKEISYLGQGQAHVVTKVQSLYLVSPLIFDGIVWGRYYDST